MENSLTHPLSLEKMQQAAATKEARHETHKKALDFLQNISRAEDAANPYPYTKTHCLCWALSLAIDPLCSSIRVFEMPYFPEVESKRPEMKGIPRAFWFNCDESGYQKRREILLSAIEETKP